MGHVKGLHEARGLPIGNLPQPKGQHTKLTGKLARLDHQQGLLERQLAVWTEKQKVTANRLILEADGGNREDYLDNGEADRGVGQRKRASSIHSSRQQKHNGVKAGQRDISVEY